MGKNGRLGIDSMKQTNDLTNLRSNDPRHLALWILYQVIYEQKEASQLLKEATGKESLKAVDKRLLLTLVYGVLKHHYALRDRLKPLLNVTNLSNKVWLILEIALYQLVFLERVPSHAIVNEAVNMAKVVGEERASGLVNGVLRNVIRESMTDEADSSSDDARVQLFTYDDTDKGLSRRFSIPLKLIKLFRIQYGLTVTKKMLSSFETNPKLFFRVANEKSSREAMIHRMRADGYPVEKSTIVATGIIGLDSSLLTSYYFDQGLITVQDESSQIVALSLKTTDDAIVYDACSAPGGKTSHIAQLVPKGHVFATEIADSKKDLITDNLQRLNLSDRVTVQIADAREADKLFEPEKFDAVLVDAPCSGMGLLRRKPDIRYHKTNQDIVALSVIQREILEAVAPLVKVGGHLVYSTCTLTQQENQLQVLSFLKNHPEFEVSSLEMIESVSPSFLKEALTPEGFLEILPHYAETDGFFIAKLAKRNKL